MEKVQWNSINKKQNGLKQSKNEKSSTLPRQLLLSALTLYDVKIDIILYYGKHKK